MTNGLGNKLVLALAIVGGIILAIIFGVILGEGNILLVGLGAAGLCGIAYGVFLNSKWIPLAFFYACLGFNIRPIGPSLAPLHFTLLLLSVFLAANFWRKRPMLSREAEVRLHFGLFEVCFVIYTAYLVVQAAFSMFYPNEPLAMSWGNLIKQYVSIWGTFAIVWFGLRMVRFAHVPRNIIQFCISSLIIGLAFNISIKIYELYILGMGSPGEAVVDTDSVASFWIPVINLTPNWYILRGLGPLGVALGIAVLAWRFTPPPPMRLTAAILTMLGFVGSLLSMGRASLLLGLLYSVIILVLRRKPLQLLFIIGISILGIVSARILYDVEPDWVPHGVQRSIAMIPGMDLPEASSDIENSSWWRKELAERALREWQYNRRTVWLGRGVYAFTESDEIAYNLDPVWGILESSLKRGITHTLATDLLVTTGAVGFIFYYMTLLALLYGTLKFQKSLSANKEPEALLLLLLLVMTFVALPLGFISSGFFDLHLALFLLLVSVAVASKQQKGSTQTGSFSSARLDIQ